MKARTERQDAGIDYGMGRSNIDYDTGIRFGVMPQHDVSQAWSDSSEGQYVYTCPYCGAELAKGIDAKRCSGCYKRIDPDRDFDNMEPVAFIYEGDGYECSQSYDDPDIFILKSPYYTYASFCSPCAPGAGYLRTPLPADVGVKTYCFGPDWFDDGKAPYDVYRVKTGRLVQARED